MKRMIAGLSTLLGLSISPAFGEEVWLTMDYVEPYKLSAPASRILVGNPGIADVEVDDPNTLLLKAISPGTTNMFILDENGEKVENLIVRVRALGDNMLTLQRGADRTTYNCMSRCEATVTVGDSASSINAVQGQVQQKQQQIDGGGGS